MISSGLLHRFHFLPILLTLQNKLELLSLLVLLIIVQNLPYQSLCLLFAASLIKRLGLSQQQFRFQGDHESTAAYHTRIEVTVFG